MRDMTVALRIRADGSVAATALNGLRRDLERVDQTAQRSSRGLASMGAALKNLAVGVGVVASLKAIGTAFLTATNDSQKLVKGLTAVTGSATAAKVEMGYISEVANRLGISIADAGEAYLSLSASAKGTVLEGKATRDIFESVSLAMAKLGKSSADTAGALTAIQQAISKDKISAEELTQQLGERLPGATKAFADSIGVTTQKLMEMMSAGELTTAQWEKFAEQLRKIYDDGQAISGVTSAWEGFKNQIDGLLVALDDQTGLTAWLDKAIRKAGELAGATKNMINGEGFRNFADDQSRFNALLEERIRLEAELKDKAQEVSTKAELGNKPGAWADPRSYGLDTTLEEFTAISAKLSEVDGKIRAIQEGKKQLEQSSTKAKDQAEAVAKGVMGGLNPKLDKVDTELATNITALLAKASEEGITLGITSGFRTAEQQAKLWEDALKKYGSAAVARKYVAPPGSSNHEKGDAVDINWLAGEQKKAQKFLDENALTFNLKFPVATEQPGGKMGFTHVELANTAKGRAKEERDAETAATKQLNAEKQRLNEIERETARVYEATRTPVEKLNLEVARLNELRAVSPTMDADTFSRGITQAQDEFVGSMLAMQSELERTQTPAKALEQVVAGLAEAYAKGDLAMAPYVKAVQALQAAYEGAEVSGDKLRTAAERMQEAGQMMGDSMAQAFEDAVLGAGSLQDILKALLQDIARIIMMKAVTEPMGNFLGDFFGKLFSKGFASGGIMTPQGAMPLLSYASGGIATSPQMALFGEGSMNEAYVPLPDGRNIPVVLKRDDQQSQPLKITINNLPGQDSRVTQDSQGGLTIDTVRAALSADMHQGGVPWVGAMERRYGMSRGRV